MQVKRNWVLYWLLMPSLFMASCTCSVNNQKPSIAPTDDFPLTIQQETKKPATDISLGQYADPPTSLGFEDRHLVARPLTSIDANDFYLGPLEQPAWIQSILDRLSKSIMDKKLDPSLLAESFPAGLVTAVNGIVSGIENLEELRFSRAPDESSPYVSLDFVLITKTYRLPGQCIVESGTGKLIHIVIAEAEEKIPRGQNGNFNPLDKTQKPTS